MVKTSLLCLAASAACASFIGPPPVASPRRSRYRNAARFTAQNRITSCANEGGEDDEDAPSKDISTDLFASLRARQAALEERLETRWKNAECESTAVLAADNWVRRLAVGDWPRCAIGTAQGSVYVADLETGAVLARALQAHPALVPGPAAEGDMRLLHGDYDGGGLTALAMRGDRVASAGRDGNCQSWRFEGDALLPIAELSTGASIVSTVVLAANAAADAAADAEVVWCASLDGKVRCFQEDPAAGCWACALEVSTGGPCLSLALCEEAGLVVVGTAEGDVELFSAADGASRGSWRPFESGGVGARAVAIANVGDERCVVAGGSDGTLRLRYLVAKEEAKEEDAGALCFADSSPGETMLPPHGGQCVALTTLDAVRGGGLLVSGAHDGTLRVWDLAEGRVDGIPSAAGPKCLYGLGGYKVWLGSVWSDGTRLVSDGRDNLVVVHDFSERPAGKEKEEEEE